MASKTDFHQHIDQTSEQKVADFATWPIRIWILAAQVLCFADAPFPTNLLAKKQSRDIWRTHNNLGGAIKTL